MGKVRCSDLCVNRRLCGRDDLGTSLQAHEQFSKLYKSFYRVLAKLDRISVFPESFDNLRFEDNDLRSK